MSNLYGGKAVIP
jgi:hypothetical protein